MSFFDIVGDVRRDAWAAASGESLLPQLCVFLVGPSAVSGAAFLGESLGRSSGVVAGLTKARLVRIFVGLDCLVAGC